MVATFEVLADESRRRILDVLVEDERPVGELVELLALSQPAVSKHLKVLRDAGLVEARTDAQRRIYRVRPEPLREIDQWLEPYRRRWAAHLNALERHLEIMDGNEEEAWT
ncbi:MAG TPA: metalloregulator ArsR/SmtB family transcription factor [Acidimicrobiales bacterium]